MAAVTSAAIGVAGSIYTQRKASKEAKAANQLGREAIEAADPFKEYRPKYAEKLDQLMSDPSSIQNTPEYKARLDAAARQLAAQGYTGSGNAIIEAANAGGASYQQAFENLARLSGASNTPGGGFDTASSLRQNASDTKTSATAGIVNNLTNLATIAGSKGGFNKGVTTGGNQGAAVKTGSNIKGGG